LYLWFRASHIYFIINNQSDASLSSLIYYLLRDYSTCFGSWWWVQRAPETCRV